jgi:YD repeat-containing protein
MTKERLGLVSAFAVLGVAAVSGWVRKPSLAPVSYSANTEPVAAPGTDTQPANGTTLPAADTTVAYDQYGQPIGSNTAAGGPSYVTSPPAEACAQPESALPSYAAPRYVRTVRTEPAFYQEEDRQLAEPRYGRARPTHHRRSVGQSVAIVGGSAGVGAAIGAIAGGGKGAGIGALAGGAGGFIYDRLTHNH